MDDIVITFERSYFLKYIQRDGEVLMDELRRVARLMADGATQGDLSSGSWSTRVY